MEVADIIQIVIALITFLGIIVSSIIAVISIKQNSKMIEETTKANIVMYIDYSPVSNKYYIIIKNFGNSIGKLISINIQPKLDWEKAEFKNKIKAITESKNVILAPKQKIGSWFEFNNYPDRKFNVDIEYETMGKIYKNAYSIDLDYIENIDWTTQYAIDDTTDNNKEVLYKINRSIQDLSDKFR